MGFLWLLPPQTFFLDKTLLIWGHMLNTTVYLHVDCIAKSPQYGSNFVIPRASKHAYNISIGVTLLAMELKLG